MMSSGSIKLKKKLCAGCGVPQYIYKSHSEEKYCKSCWDRKRYAEGDTKPIVKASKPISKRSDKKIKVDESYRIIRVAYLKNHPTCEANIKGVCSGQPSDQIHHMAGKTGDLYLDDKYFLAVEFNCHRWITDHPKEAMEMGFSQLRLNK